MAVHRLLDDSEIVRFQEISHQRAHLGFIAGDGLSLDEIAVEGEEGRGIDGIHYASTITVKSQWHLRNDSSSEAGHQRQLEQHLEVVERGISLLGRDEVEVRSST